MSSIYALEPATSGKVVLHTTVGDIEVELWAKETPLACRNFVQHCLDGYYRGCTFHRVVKDFIIQTGDPTNTGDGGEAAYGAPFPLEVHSRLRFNHRGVVAMASSAEGNASQFFFLMAQQAEQLNRKHTIFGKVAGDTIYNLAKINDSDLGPNDGPLFPARITGAEILWDPFDGELVARKTRAQEEEEEEERKRKSKRKPKATKNAALLSFGGDEEEEEEEREGESVRGRMKARQHFSKKREVREGIAIQEEEEKERKRKRREERAREKEKEDIRLAEKEREEKESSERSFDEHMRKRLLSSMASASASASAPTSASASASTSGCNVSTSAAVEEESSLEAKAGDKRKKRAGLRILEEQRSKYRKRSKAERQAMTLARLEAFQSSLRAVDPKAVEAKKQQQKQEKEAEEEEEQNAESYSARLMYGKAMDDDDDEEDPNDDTWKAHSLKFARTVATANEDDYVVLDPTAPGAEGMAEKWGRGESGRNRDDRHRGRGDDRRDRRSDRGGGRDRRDRDRGDWGRDRHRDRGSGDRRGDGRDHHRQHRDRGYDSRDRRR